MSTTTAPIKTIAAALKLVDTKKESLKKAFQDLQSHSSLLSSFPLDWSYLDAHFAFAHASLTTRFLRLESLDPQPATVNDHSSSVPAGAENDPSPSGPGELARPELKKFCDKMDGKGLRRYIGDVSSQRSQIKNELSDAMRSAPDPATLVLDAVEGFYVRVKGGWDSDRDYLFILDK